MPSPFNVSSRLPTADAPTWVLYLLTAIAVTATALVAGHRTAATDVVPTAAATTEAAAAAAPGPPSRARAVSRSAPRTSAGPTPRSRVGRPGAARQAHGSARRAQARRTQARPIPRAQAQPQRVRKQPLASSNAVETVAAARNSTANVPGQCLAWSRQQAGIPSRYSDAATAWRHATGRRPDDANPPRGAAVYWTGGSRGHGHVAISLGNGEVRSSDAGGSGQVATVPLREISNEWGLEYAGWANSINGYTIPGVVRT